VKGMEPQTTRCGFAALIGAPNSGKSTLINQLVGTKVSIVSRKVQTTRRAVRGIAIEGNAQIVFVDTPGIFAPRRRLERAMVASAWGSSSDADATALLVDARKGVDVEAEAILGRLPQTAATKILVLNKIDIVERPRLLELAPKLNGAFPFAQTFMISALRGDGIAKFKQELAALMPPGPWLYPEDQISDAPLRLLAAEITREKLFERLHDELPYASTVETELWQHMPDGSARIEQTVYVLRKGHKKIVIGERGRTIKAIGVAARKEIMAAAGQNVHLFLFVKVRANWTDDPQRYREMGLEFPKE
jgi:GTP-binding protein Era